MEEERAPLFSYISAGLNSEDLRSLNYRESTRKTLQMKKRVEMNVSRSLIKEKKGKHVLTGQPRLVRVFRLYTSYNHKTVKLVDLNPEMM